MIIIRIRFPNLCQEVTHLSLERQLVDGRQGYALRQVSMFGDQVEECWNHMPKQGSQRILVERAEQGLTAAAKPAFEV